MNISTHGAGRVWVFGFCRYNDMASRCGDAESGNLRQQENRCGLCLPSAGRMMPPSFGVR
ncbi:MAG: hypothetical protein QM537_07940 [Candidatus Symbiobacter sp.]|nr:hypothetical protein [Candidatus Symbiobacter sp.]